MPKYGTDHDQCNLKSRSILLLFDNHKLFFINNFRKYEILPLLMESSSKVSCLENYRFRNIDNGQNVSRIFYLILLSKIQLSS